MIQAELCQGNQISILNEQFSIDVTFNIFYSKAKVDKTNALYVACIFDEWPLDFIIPEWAQHFPGRGSNFFQVGGPIAFPYRNPYNL